MDYSLFFNQFTPIDVQCVQQLLAHCKTRQYKKGELITREGQIQRELLLVEEGIQMSYFSNEGKMHIIAFTYPPSLSGIPDSFFFQKPAQYHLEALTDSTFLAIDYQVLNQLFDEYPSLERLFRKMTEAVLSGFIGRYYELHAFTIEQRFQHFAKRSPHLFQLIPHKYIANYLNINPTNFSKLYNSIKI